MTQSGIFILKLGGACGCFYFGRQSLARFPKAIRRAARGLAHTNKLRERCNVLERSVQASCASLVGR